MLPPPTTIAISTPRAWTAATPAAIASHALGIGAVLELAHQRLAGQLQQHAAVDGGGLPRRSCGSARRSRLSRRRRTARSGGSRCSRRILAETSARSSSIVLPSCLSSLTCFWRSRTTSSSHLSSLPFDDLLAHVLRPVGRLLGGDSLLALAVLGRDSSSLTASGAAAAMWSARSRANSTNSSLRATKSVWQSTSTITPILLPAWM